jgi:hypothetical protein
VAAQAGSGATRLCEEEPAGSVKQQAGELGAREIERVKQEEEDEDLFVNFAEV